MKNVFLSSTILFFITFNLNCEEFTITKKNIGLAFQEANKLGISIDIVPDEFVIAVSPVRQTMQVVHSSARLVGALVSEVQNENFRKDLEKVVGELNGHILLHNQIIDSFKTKLNIEIVQVPPLGSTARYKTDEEAREERLENLRKKNLDLLLDLKITCGIYGPEGEMFFKYTGTLYDFRKEKTIWRGTAVLSPSIALKVTEPYNTYFNPFKSNLFSPRLTISEDALTRWIENNGENYRTLQEAGIKLTIATLLGELELENTGNAFFGLGMSKLFEHKWKKAIPYFEEAWKKTKTDSKIGNGLIVSLYKSKKIEDAIKISEELIKEGGKVDPTTHYNLAWIYLDKKKDLSKAREYYQQYKDITGKPDVKLEKKLNKNKI